MSQESDPHFHDKSILDEKAFKTSYIANFLASYMALNYDDDCQNGHAVRRHIHQPVEDASYLANCAWDQIQEVYRG